MTSIDDLKFKIEILESRIADLELKIADLLSNKYRPTAYESLISSGDEDDFGGSPSEDPKYAEAKRMVIKTGMASVSMLQRGLSIGYARAGKLIDQLEKDGIIGPHQGSTSREVLISTIDED
jgi:DNA segregation ATPase FtsK/SpoIIIE, S-DNA-T family